LNTNVGISTLSSALFLAFCLPINAAILWAYWQRRKQQQSASVGLEAQGTMSIQNAAAKAKEELIKRRLLLFAVLTFFGHALITVAMVSQMNRFFF
jgi:predicted negative regulator of RcsB-dependent stress response